MFSWFTDEFLSKYRTEFVHARTHTHLHIQVLSFFKLVVPISVQNKGLDVVKLNQR